MNAFSAKSSATSTRGWFKAIRSDDALELIRSNPNAFLLAYFIAHRARWREGFNQHGLEQGEALLGDFQNYGMTARQYRTAKNQLTKGGFATFKTTNKGTVAKLNDTRLFSTAFEPDDKQKDKRPTVEGQASGKQTTTNEESKKGSLIEGKTKPISKFRSEALDLEKL